jgi:chromosome segregation ATPase
MARKIFSWILILLGAVFLILSVSAIITIWIYKGPLTRDAVSQLEEIDRELALAETTLHNSELELARALRIVDATQTALEELTEQTSSAESLFERIQSTLDDRLLPELKTTRTRIESARATLVNLQTVLAGVSGFIPGVDLTLPDQILADLITSAQTLDGEIANVELLATQASLFVSDTSYLLGGDLTQTRESLQSFLTSIQEYQKKVTIWRAQAADLAESAPRWIDQASIGLTLFLLWFGISQVGLILHGRTILRRSEIVVREEEVS